MTDHNDSLDILETYTYQLEINEPGNYERVPDILDFLTYIEETRDKETGAPTYERKRLTPLEKEVYRVIKRFARDKACWKNRDDIAFEVNCSAGAITNAKRILEMPFEQLDGKSLITIEKRRLPTYHDDKKINTKPNDVITVMHIWNYNRAFMSIIKKIDYKETYRCGQITPKEVELLLEKMAQGVMNKEIVHKSGAESPDDYGGGGRSTT